MILEIGKSPAHQGKETLESKAPGPHIPETPLAIMSDITFLQLVLGSKEPWSARSIVTSHQARGVFTMRGGTGVLV